MSLREPQKYIQLMELSNKMLFLFFVWKHESTKNKPPDMENKKKPYSGMFTVRLSIKLKIYLLMWNG